jgi:hypothetical protein
MKERQFTTIWLINADSPGRPTKLPKTEPPKARTCDIPDRVAATGISPMCTWRFRRRLLRDMSVSDVAERLMPVVDEMARQVEDVIIDAREGRTPLSDCVTIEEWLVVWNDYFRH